VQVLYRQARDETRPSYYSFQGDLPDDIFIGEAFLNASPMNQCEVINGKFETITLIDK
jgi:hypothetical protein